MCHATCDRLYNATDAAAAVADAALSAHLMCGFWAAGNDRLVQNFAALRGKWIEVLSISRLG